jgi:Leucine-rich repeat (LRR) protein
VEDLVLEVGKRHLERITDILSEIILLVEMYTVYMSKKNVLILVVVVFLVSGLFYRQVFRAGVVSVPINSTGTTTGNSTSGSTTGQTTVSIDKNKILDISGQGLDKLPAYVLNLTGLEELNISNNNITGALPSQMQNLRKLKILNASNNLMTGVPAEIGQLSNLEILDLSNNQLTGLPNELANLKKLKVLNLSGNNYSVQDLEVIKRGLSSTVQIIL